MSHQTIYTTKNADLIDRLLKGARDLVIDPSMLLTAGLPDGLFELMKTHMPMDEVESYEAELLADGSILFHLINPEFELMWLVNSPLQAS